MCKVSCVLFEEYISQTFSKYKIIDHYDYNMGSSKLETICYWIRENICGNHFPKECLGILGRTDDNEFIIAVTFDDYGTITDIIKVHWDRKGKRFEPV